MSLGFRYLTPRHFLLNTFLANYHSILKNNNNKQTKNETHGSLLASGARMWDLIPAAGEEAFWCPNMLSLVSFAGMTVNKCAVLWIGTLTGGPVQGESTPVLLKKHIYKLIPEHQYVVVPP